MIDTNSKISNTNKKEIDPIVLELEVKNNLNKLKKIIDSFYANNITNNSKPNLKSKDIIKEYNSLKNNFIYLEDEYNKTVTKSHSYSFSTNYSSLEDDLNNNYSDSKQLTERYKDKIKNNDSKLELLINEVSKGKKTAFNINDNLSRQNFLLEALNNDIDKTEKAMIKTTGKIEKFIKNSSFCKLYTIIIIEILCLVFIIILM